VSSACGSAIELTERADRCGPQAELLAQVRAIQASVHSCTLDRDAQARTSQEALLFLRPGSLRWSRAVKNLVQAESARGNGHIVRDWVHRVLEVVPEPDAASEFQWMMASALYFLCSNGDFALSRQLYEYAHSLQQTFQSTWVQSRMWLAQSQYLRLVEPDPWQQVVYLQEALDHSERAEEIEFIIISGDFLGESQGELGRFAAGEATLRKSLERARQAKHEYLTIHAQLHLCELLSTSAQREQLEEAASLAREALAATKLSVGFREWAHGLLARALLSLGDAPGAEIELQKALALPELSPIRRLLLEGLRLECLLAQGRAAEAEADLSHIVPKWESLGSAGYAEIPLRLAVAETLLARGQQAEAVSHLELAQIEIERRAQKIPDVMARESFRTRVPEHERVLAALRRTA
jgi:eukaryotic-like serine/threonine-protein kinase